MENKLSLIDNIEYITKLEGNSFEFNENEIEKEYLIWVSGEITEQKLDLLRHGLTLDDKPLREAGIKAIDDHHIQFILKEGRKRQIRRMCDLVGLKVTRLMRVRIGQIRLENLPVGKWRHLGPKEHF